MTDIRGSTLPHVTWPGSLLELGESPYYAPTLISVHLQKQQMGATRSVTVTLDAAWPGITAAAASVCPGVPVVESGRGFLWAFTSQQDPLGALTFQPFSF